MRFFPEFFPSSKKREPKHEKYGGREITPYKIDPAIRERAQGWYDKYYPSNGIPGFDGKDAHQQWLGFYECDLEERILPKIDQLTHRPNSGFSLEVFEKILERREVVEPWDIGNWLLEFELFILTRDAKFADNTISQEELDTINSQIGEVAMSQLFEKLDGEHSKELMEKLAELKHPPDFYFKEGHNKSSKQGY